TLPATRGAGAGEGYRGTSPLDPLLEAYAQGARALGQVTPATLLDASDYTTGGRRTGRPDFDRSQEPSWKEAEAESKPAEDEQGASTVPHKLQAPNTPAEVP